MNTNIDTFSITDLRHRTNQVIASAKKYGYAMLFRNSKKTVAIVDPEYLSSLQAAHEDYLDSLEYDKTINNPTITWSQYKQRHSK